MENNSVVFSIPTSCVPPQKGTELTQVETRTKKITSQAGVKFGLQVGIEMAYPIVAVESPSHPIKVKKTDTKAVVELRASNQGNPLDRDFVLKVNAENPVCFSHIAFVLLFV